MSIQNWEEEFDKKFPIFKSIRPNINDFPWGCYYFCSCGKILQTREDIGEHILLGHADKVVEEYKSIIYTAKASKSERNRGCEELEEKVRVRQELDETLKEMGDIAKAFNREKVEIKNFIKQIETKTRQETIKEIGQEFKKWFYSDDLKEPIEDAIERITGIKI